MRKIIIAGAGQMGRAAARIMDPNSAVLLGFADNDPDKWSLADGSYPENSNKIPVFSIQTAGLGSKSGTGWHTPFPPPTAPAPCP